MGTIRLFLPWKSVQRQGPDRRRSGPRQSTRFRSEFNAFACISAGSQLDADSHLRLARIGPHEQHAAVTVPDVGGLHGHCRAVQQDDLVAPVELIDLTRREGLPPNSDDTTSTKDLPCVEICAPNNSNLGMGQVGDDMNLLLAA
jgi:hypothetical protein